MSESQTRIHYTALLNREPMAIITIDSKGVIADAETIKNEWNGFNRTELVGQKMNNLIHHDMTAGWLRTGKRTVLTGKAWRGVVKCCDKDGNGHWSDIYVIPQWREKLFYGAQIVLFPCAEPVKQRAEYAYQYAEDWQPQPAPLNRNLMMSTVLLIATLVSVSLLSNLWLTTLVGVLLGLAAILLHRASLTELHQPAEHHSNTIDPLMCYIFTGGTDEPCKIHYAMDNHQIEIQTLNTLMSRNQDELRQTNQQHLYLIKRTDQLLYEQKKETQGIHHALRNMLDDQHQATCAATRSMQLILESQQAATQGRSALNRLSRTSRHQLSRLERMRDQLNALACRSQDISNIIDALSEATEETHFMMHLGQEPDNPSGVAVANREVHHLTTTTRASIGGLARLIEGWRNTIQYLAHDMDADIQRTQHSLLLIQETDRALQAILSVMNRLNALALSIDNTMHHQAILRATTSYRTDALQEHIVSALAVNKDMHHQVEKMTHQLSELSQLVLDFTQAIERARA